MTSISFSQYLIIQTCLKCDFFYFDQGSDGTQGEAGQAGSLGAMVMCF